MNYYRVYVVCLISYLVNEVCTMHASANDVDISTTSSVYYDPKSRLPFRITSIENSLMNKVRPYDQSSTKTNGNIRRISYRSNGCTCQDLTCGCCAGINLNQFNFNREGCMNFTYDPMEFSINMDMFMDQNSVFSNSLSAKYPPPLCIPIPLPFLPLSVEACARLYDVYTPGRNLHMCFDFETKIQRATVLVLHFDCMRMGSDGIALVKPGDAGGLPPSSSSPTTETQVDSDVYDEVTEVKYKKPKKTIL